jgi:hypothetical protein
VPGQNTPNVICANRINPVILPYLQALPTPTSGDPTNNYLAPPVPDTILGNIDYYLGRVDVQFKGNDHVFASVLASAGPAKFVVRVATAIANETYSDPQNSWVNRSIGTAR